MEATTYAEINGSFRRLSPGDETEENIQGIILCSLIKGIIIL